MGKSINSRELLLLARKKSKDLKLYFDGHSEIKDNYGIIEQMLYFCFLNLECLCAEEKISKKIKTNYEIEFERYAQEMAENIYPMERMYIKNEEGLQGCLRDGNYEMAVGFLASMLDYSRNQVFEGKYTLMCNEYYKRHNPDIDDKGGWNNDNG